MADLNTPGDGAQLLEHALEPRQGFPDSELINGFRGNGFHTNGTNGHAHTNGHPSGYNTSTAVITTAPRTLADRHREALEARGLKTPALTARGYYSEAEPVLLEGRGFSRRNPNQCLPGLVIPRFDYRGQEQVPILRPDLPRTDTSRQDKRAIKYETPIKTAGILSFSPLTLDKVQDVKAPLVVTESDMKADAAAQELGAAAIGLNGVNGITTANPQGGRTVNPDFDAFPLNGRPVYVAFDSDVATNPRVEQALHKVCGVLGYRKAVVKVVYLPVGPNGEKTGLDDFFARGGTPADFYALAQNIKPVGIAKAAEREQENEKIKAHARALGRPVIETADRQLPDIFGETVEAVAAYNARKKVFYHAQGGLTLVTKTKTAPPSSRRAVPSSQADTWRRRQYGRPHGKRGCITSTPREPLPKRFKNHHPTGAASRLWRASLRPRFSRLMASWLASPDILRRPKSILTCRPALNSPTRPQRPTT